MGSKAKGRHKRLGTDQLVALTERHLATGKLRQALKDAKACHRQQPTDATHRLLERAHIARAQHLLESGMRDEARKLLDMLVELGVTDEAVGRQLPSLMASLGINVAAVAPVENLSPQEQGALEGVAADIAVVYPGEAKSCSDEVADAARRVREALDALSRDDEAAGLAAVSHIDRHSPFADWKLFVRGLAAWNRRDDQRAEANWRRLDSQRAPHRIASGLRAAADPQAIDDSLHRTTLRKLEQSLYGEPVLRSLDELGKLLAASRWDKVLQQWRTLQKTLQRGDPRLLERVTRVLVAAFVGDAPDYALRRLLRISDSSPLDPNWHHAWGWHYDLSGRRSEKILAEWEACAADLTKCTTVAPEERRAAEALIRHRIGLRLRYVLESPRFYFYDEDEAEDTAREDAVFASLARAVELAPEWDDGHASLVGFSAEYDRCDEAVEVFERTLQECPNHVDRLVFLGRHYLRGDDVVRGRDYLLRAAALRPGDANLSESVTTAGLIVAREMAHEKRWDEGRNEFETVLKRQPGGTPTAQWLAARACFELKAVGTKHVPERFRGDPQASSEAARQTTLLEFDEINPDTWRYVDATLAATVEEPAAGWLPLAIQAARYGLPAPIKKAFKAGLTVTLSEAPHPATAAALARTMHPYVVAETRYHGQVTHVKQVIKYLRGCRDLGNWELHQLRGVCEFLADVEEGQPLLEDLARAGNALFLDAACFPFYLGQALLRNGSNLHIAHQADFQFHEAIERAERSHDPADRKLLDEIRHHSTAIKEWIRREERYTFGMMNPFAYHDDDDDEYEDDGDPGYTESDAGGGDSFGSATPDDPREELREIVYAIERGHAPPEIEAKLRAICEETGVDFDTLRRDVMSAGR